MTRCSCYDTLVVKNLNRWFKEKWVDVSRKAKDGKHPPCGRSKAKTSSKGYPKCRPSVKVSSKTPKTSGSMSEGQKRAATKRKRAKKQGVGGKPTVVKILKEHDDELHDMAGMSKEEMAQLFLEENREATMNPNTPRPLGMKDYAKLENELKPYLQAIMEGRGIPEDEQVDQLFEEINHRHIENHPTGHGTPFSDARYPMEFQDRFKSEPMDLAWRLLKSPVSPEAKRHKLEYDKKYESSPERVKYREELNRERRKRGIYGRGGPDMSHTKDHTLVAESPHANRARHFKERGTLKSNDILVVSR